MRILDWFRSLLARGASVTASPASKSPLDLPVGTLFGYYRERYVVTGIRVVRNEGGTRFDHCAEGQDGSLVVVSATEDGRLSLGRVLPELPDWTTNEHKGLDDEPLRLVATHTCRVSHEGRDTCAPARQVTSRRFEDEAGDAWLLLEQYGEARQARRVEPIFREELTVGDELESAAEEQGETGVVEAAVEAAGGVVANVQKGSPAAAALALTGTGMGQAVEIDHDPTAYDDDEWADAEFDVESSAAGSVIEDSPDAASVWDAAFAGRRTASHHPDDEDDDWLAV